ncbi:MULTISPECIES: general secretion pathway protein GspN [Stenotrophomonas]|uniref:general secretion pathway protein GspN n=1 Tax=Stenotrophomonas TaxID=40323 RepID=UPI00087284D3|nr:MULTISPECIES: general secretion pathway protein GspN [Stenotrophomonas]OEZ00934.1 general secretion pathway protein GspN [Stenotrophomonas sp. BIIR7]
MKIELASLRSWWLGGVVAWAAAIWIATLFGVGGRIAPPDAGDRVPPALPTLAPAAPERLASAESYAAIGARPLFAEDRKPRPYLLGGSDAGSTSSAVTLTGVLLTSEFGMAILTTDQKQSLRLRLNGEAVNGWQLVALEPRSATVNGPGGTQTLELVTFSGQGGEPPTVLGTAAAAGQGNAVRQPPPPPSSPPPRVPSASAQAAEAAANAAANAAAAAAAATQTPNAQPPAQGPSEQQMQAIRARIQARRQQLQQQQQSQQPPSGGSGQTK